MTRETRSNLLFLTLFLALSLPGAVILVRKKLDPSAPRMDQPDPVVHRLPYMAPLPAPPDMRWVVPPRTRLWVDGLFRQRGGSGRVLSAGANGREWEPVISPDHRVQVIGVTSGAGDTDLQAIAWEPIGGIAVALDGTPGRVSTDAVTVPADVRRELMNYGMIRPPASVEWLRANFPNRPQAGRSHQLDLTYPPGTDPPSARLTFDLPLQSPAETTHG